MFEIRITLVSKAESLLGIMIDQGECQHGDDKWIPFVRVRVGIIFLTLDIVKLSTEKN